jgi:serine/threonine protein kinase
MIGQIVSHYRIIEKLGGGGMGVVYKAEDTKLKRAVALKFLPEELSRDRHALERFEREAQAASALNHPNIAAIHGLEEHEGKRFFVLELVEGQTLAERLKKGRIALDETLDICRQIAEGLEAAHEKGIIHRDLKPANVKVTPEGKVKVLDFSKQFVSQGMVEVSIGVQDKPDRPAAELGHGRLDFLVELAELAVNEQDTILAWIGNVAAR